MYFFCEGIFVGTLSADNFNIGRKCMGQKSIEDFKSCFQQNNEDYIKRINLNYFKQRTYLSKYNMFKVILPEDGSVISKRDPYNATLTLDPSFVYIMCLYDKDFLIYVSNSLIVQRSCLKINKNTYYTGIEVKVINKC